MGYLLSVLDKLTGREVSIPEPCFGTITQTRPVRARLDTGPDVRAFLIGSPSLALGQRVVMLPYAGAHDWAVLA